VLFAKIIHFIDIYVVMSKQDGEWRERERVGGQGRGKGCEMGKGGMKRFGRVNAHVQMLFLCFNKHIL
jgi:hypothetical protein